MLSDLVNYWPRQVAPFPHMHLFPEPSPELLRRYDTPGPRYTSYPTAPEWSAAFGPDDYAQRLARAGRDSPGDPLSLYTHLPFCKELCSYCGCNVVVAKSTQSAEPYLRAVEAELALAARALGARRQVSQLHWGGGTPTFLSLEQLERLFGAITGHFELLPGAEVAIEIDPVVTSREQLALLRRLGFNRLSMGVQDFDPRVQQAVRRIQPFEQTRELVEVARELGFSTINFDLIYGLPHQTPDSWAATLERVGALRPERLALYSFAYVPKVRPNQRLIDAAALPEGLEKLRLFLLAGRALVGSGYLPVGMDHFALPGDELATAMERGRLSRNFQGYTVASSATVVAFGATGISDLGDTFAQNVRPLKEYSAAVESGRFATERGLALDADDLLRRRLITSLMCNLELNLAHFAESPGAAAERFSVELRELPALERDGLVTTSGPGGLELTLTPLGRLFPRNVAMLFDARLRRSGHGGTFSRTV